MLHHLEKLPATPGGLPWAVGFVCWWAASAGQESLPGGVDSEGGGGGGGGRGPWESCPGPGKEGGWPGGGRSGGDGKTSGPPRMGPVLLAPGQSWTATAAPEWDAALELPGEGSPSAASLCWMVFLCFSCLPGGRSVCSAEEIMKD